MDIQSLLGGCLFETKEFPATYSCAPMGLQHKGSDCISALAHCVLENDCARASLEMEMHFPE